MRLERKYAQQDTIRLGVSISCYCVEYLLQGLESGSLFSQIIALNHQA